MAYNYATLVNTATRMITDFGRDVVLRRVTSGTYNPTTGTTTGDATADETIRVVFTDYDKQTIDAGLVERGDKNILLFAEGVAEPKTTDIIVDGSVQYKIITVSVVKPGNTAILYKIQGRV